MLSDLEAKNEKKLILLFADTYINKQYACALALVNQMVESNIVPIFTISDTLPKGINCDALVYFNMPLNLPPSEYDNKPRILIDHGASHLKWFLANKERFSFFDKILTAGEDHVDSLLAFFPASGLSEKVKAAGFIKSRELFSQPKFSREELCRVANLDASKEIVLFAPTWYKFSERSLRKAIYEISKVENHVASLHPETDNVNTDGLNIVKNKDGLTLELLKHADIVVSEVSSTIYEALALGKKTIQLILTEYSDNKSIMYDMPLTAGTSELFCGGVLSRPDKIRESIESLLCEPEDYKEFYSVVRKRLLSGTNISPNASELILSELRNLPDSNLHSISGLDEAASKGIVECEARAKLAQNLLIAHGGGRYRGIKSSNSKEAILETSSHINYIEVDIVKLSDGYAVAHDGLEEKYGFDSKFKEKSKEEFLNSRFETELTPLTIENLFSLMVKKQEINIIFDIKEVDANYHAALCEIERLSSDFDVKSRCIIQCYCNSDFESARAFGFEKVLLAVWKYYYKDPVGKDAFNFIADCLEIDKDRIVGITVPYSNKLQEEPTIDRREMKNFYSFWKRIYIHGVPFGEFSRVLRMNFGLFLEGINKEIEFSELPAGFNWVEYLYLNSGLIEKSISDPVSAMKHYIKYGQFEARKFKFNVPANFDWKEYCSNRQLRLAGVGSPVSAQAHFTMFGDKSK